MQTLMKTVDQFVKKEDETYQRVLNVLTDDVKVEVLQESVMREKLIPNDSSLDTVNSFFESSIELNIRPSTKLKPVEHYDSYITDNYVKTAMESEKDAEKEMEEVAKPRDWREEYADYKKLHPEMDVEEIIDLFDNYWINIMHRMWIERFGRREDKN